MSFGDDDDLAPSSLSSSERYTRADKGKKEKLKKQIAEKLGAEKSVKADKATLKSKMDLQRFKEQMAGKSDEETRRKEERDRKAEEGISSGTKTRKQKEEASISTAQDQPKPDLLIERQKQQEGVSEEEKTNQAD